VKAKWIKMYLDFADRAAEESHAVRLKVGAIFVSPKGVVSTGINGLPAGGDNVCEEEVYADSLSDKTVLRTKVEVSHAEENLFSKLMRQGVSTEGGWVFLTHEPCINCAKIIAGSGVEAVVYRTPYAGSHKTGKEWLRQNDVICESEEYMYVFYKPKD
jgi:dCMP deaminase